MIEIQMDKRNRSFLMILVFIGLALATPFAANRFFDLQDNENLTNAFTGLMFLFIGLGTCCWLKGFYHWSKGKGQSGALTVIGLLGMPIALIVMAFIKDSAPTPPPIDDPIKACPQCGAKYRLGDYNPDAKKIFCSICKTELLKT